MPDHLARQPSIGYPLRKRLRWRVADARRAVARRWKRAALAVYEWIWP